MDNGTQLVWQRAPVTQMFSYDDAQAYCASAAVEAGAAPWRLPNVKELWTLVDFTRSTAPAVDQGAFPGTPADYFWTDTVYADGPGGGPVNAWVVDFSSGSGANRPFAEKHFVRCVH